MLLDTYKAEERFWLLTLHGATATPGLDAFRGDFVVLEGELKETAGKRAPPKALLKQAVILATADQILMISGNFASIDELPDFVARFGSELAPDCLPVFFIDNLGESCQVQIGANRYVLIQFSQGMVWNALMDELYVDKSDLKGLEGEEKVLALYQASKSHAYKYPERTLDDVLAAKTAARREGWGAV